MSSVRVLFVVGICAVFAIVIATLMRNDVAPTRADTSSEPSQKPDTPSPTASPPPARGADPQAIVIVNVVDAVTQQPVAGVRVTIGHAESRAEAWSVNVIDRQPTDANGQVRILAPPDIELVASLDRTLLAEAVFATPSVTSETTITLRVEPSASFAGRVQTASGEPIGGATVGVGEQFNRDRKLTRERMRNSVMGETDASGNYRLTGLRVDPAAKYAVFANADGYKNSSRVPVEAVTGATTEVAPIVLQRAAIEIVGTIVADGCDIAGRTLRVNGTATSSQEYEMTADGRFSIGVEQAGTYTLVLEGLCLDGAPSAIVTVPKDVVHVDRGILRAAPATTHYTGRVVRTDGVPVTAGHVSFGFVSSDIAPDGTFDLVSCFAGPHELQVWAGESFSRCIEITPAFTFAGTTNNELRVTPRGILVRFVRAGEPTLIERRVTVTVLCGGTTFGDPSPRVWPIAEQRLQFLPTFPMKCPTGRAEVTVTVVGLPPVVKSVELGAVGMYGPEQIVTFDHAELGLE